MILYKIKNKNLNRIFCKQLKSKSLKIRNIQNVLNKQQFYWWIRLHIKSTTHKRVECTILCYYGNYNICYKIVDS